MQVNILEPKKTIYKGMAREVILPAADGEVCVLDFHQPFLMRLRKGDIRSSEYSISIKDGIAFMRANELSIFVEP